MGNKGSSIVDTEHLSEEAMDALPEAPIQLIEVSDEGVFSIGEQAKAALRALGPGKICVVAVAGLYRTGKSSLVNFLLERKEGFEVGPTIARCTRGIWMWGRPRQAMLPNGETAWVLLLDTEGIGGLEADASYDLRVFSLATLLCSTLVYNSLGTIDETAISSLSFVAQLTRHIRVNPAHNSMPSPGGDEDEHDADADAELEATQFSRYFPSFTWVLRDFALDLVDERGEPISPDDYLEQSLRPQVGFDEATSERNRIREMLTAFFSERKCFPLVRPLVDEQRLQEIDKVPLNELREEFREQLDELKSFLYFHHLKPKVVNNVALNGSSFIGLAEEYISAMSNGGVPTISSAWQEVMQKECEAALMESLEHYDADIKRLMAEIKCRGTEALELDALVELHARSLKSAIAVFQARAGGEEASAYQEQLEAQLIDRFSDLAKQNMETSDAKCSETIQSLFKSIIEPKLTTGADGYGSASEGPYASLQSDLNILGANYRSSPAASGPAKGAVLARFYDEQVLDAVRWLAQRLEDEHEQRVEEVREQMATVTAKLASVEAREKVYNESIEKTRTETLALQTEKLRLDSVQQASETRVSQLLVELQERNDHISQLKLELDETKEAIESEQHWQSTLSEKLEKTQRAHDEKSSEYASLHATHTSHKLSSEESIADIKATLKQQEAENAKTQAGLAAADEQLRFKIGELESKRKQIDEAKQQISGLQADLMALKSERDDLVDEHTAVVANFESTIAEIRQEKEILQGELQHSKDRLDGMVIQTEADFKCQEKALAEAVNEGEERSLTIKNYEKLMRQQEKQLSDLRAQGQRKIAQLQNMVEKHKSDYNLAKNQLSRKGSRELELETRLEQERQLRESTVADKDNQIFGLQKDLQERISTLKITELRTNEMQERIDAQTTEIVQLRAQQSVLMGEKEKQQRMWEAAMHDHFANLHEKERHHGNLQEDHDKLRSEKNATEARLQRKLEEYKILLEQMQTKKEGLLKRQKKGGALFGSIKWQVQHVSLVGCTLVCKNPDKIETPGQAEKHITFRLTSDSEVVPYGERKYAFSVKTGDTEELVLCAVDKGDMDEWIREVESAVKAIRGQTEAHERRFLELQAEEMDLQAEQDNVKEGAAAVAKVAAGGGV